MHHTIAGPTVIFVINLYYSRTGYGIDVSGNYRGQKCNKSEEINRWI